MKSKSISIYLSMLNGEVMTRKIVKDALARGKKVYVPFIDARSMDYGKDRESVRRMHMNMVSLRSKEDLKQCELRRDKWGIPSISPDSVSSRFSILDPDCGRIWKDESPSEKRLWLPSLEEQESTEATLDMIVVPGLAFDRQCRRLGHGKGYYDIFLESYHTEKVDRSKGKTMPYVGQSSPPQARLYTSDHYLVGLALNEQVLPPEESIPVHKNDWVLDALLMGDGSIFRNERAPRESVIEKIDPLDLGPSRTEIF